MGISKKAYYIRSISGAPDRQTPPVQDSDTNLRQDLTKARSTNPYSLYQTQISVRRITRDISKQLKASIDCRSCNKKFNPDLSASSYFQLEEVEQLTRTNSAWQDDTVNTRYRTDHPSDSEESLNEGIADLVAREEEIQLTDQEEQQVTTDQRLSNKEKATDQLDYNIQTDTQRDENPALGEVYRVYDCDLEGISKGEPRYLGYPIREERTFNIPNYRGALHCPREEITEGE